MEKPSAEGTVGLVGLESWSESGREDVEDGVGDRLRSARASPTFTGRLRGDAVGSWSGEALESRRRELTWVCRACSKSAWLGEQRTAFVEDWLGSRASDPDQSGLKWSRAEASSREVERACNRGKGLERGILWEDTDGKGRWRQNDGRENERSECWLWGEGEHLEVELSHARHNLARSSALQQAQQ